MWSDGLEISDPYQFVMCGALDMDQKFLILICNVWSDGQGSDISDPYSFRVMNMDWKILILVCEAMDMNQKFLILNCLCDGNGSEISFILCDGNGLEISNLLRVEPWIWIRSF